MKQLVCAVLLINGVCFADNTINIDQIGDSNYIVITQDGAQHSATVALGKNSNVDYTTLSIVQQGTGAKTASVEIKSGTSNGVNIFQDGTGAHTASIQNLTGNGNSIGITQTGAGNHIMNITNPLGAANTGNTVSATQSGGQGADKRFDLTFNGATGAGVTINQTNPTTADTGGMNIQCNPCGNSWSYIKY